MSGKEDCPQTDLGSMGSPPVGKLARDIDEELRALLSLDPGSASEILIESSGTTGDRGASRLTDLDLLMVRGAAARYERFAAGSSDETVKCSRVLGLQEAGVGAALFSLAERVRERERLRAPREVLLGLGSTLVEGMSSVNLNVTQHMGDLRVLRLEIPSEIAGCFLLTDLKIGRNSQFVGGGAIPMDLFSVDSSCKVNLRADSWRLSQFLTLSVTNKNQQALNFQGAVVCCPQEEKSKSMGDLHGED